MCLITVIMLFEHACMAALKQQMSLFTGTTKLGREVCMAGAMSTIPTAATKTGK